MARSAVKVVSRTLHYKRAQIVGGAPQSLQLLLSAAHARETHPLRRAEHIGDETSSVRVIDKPYIRHSMLCGWMFDYAEDSHQPILSLGDDTLLELAVSLLAPREKEQFLRAVLFFGVQNNHVILLQSQGLFSGHFESHLNWLLTDHTDVLPAGERVMLNDYPPRRTRDRLSGVKSITLSGSLPGVNSLAGAQEQRKDHKMLDAIANAVGEVWKTSGVFAEGPQATTAMAEDRLQAELQIRLPRGRRKAATLDELAHLLRHNDADVMGVTTSSGRYLSGGDLRLSKSVRVRAQGGMLIAPDVGRVMQQWLIDLLKSGELVEDVDV